MAEKKHFNDFKDGGGGHLVKWWHTSAVAFFGLSRFDLVCVPNFIKFGRYMGE
jgi:hypothetical protein